MTKIVFTSDPGLHRFNTMICPPCAPGFPRRHNKTFLEECQGLVHAVVLPSLLTASGVKTARLERCDSCDHNEIVRDFQPLTELAREVLQISEEEAAICESLIKCPATPDDLSYKPQAVLELLEGLRLKGLVHKSRPTNRVMCPACGSTFPEEDEPYVPRDSCGRCTFGEELVTIFTWSYAGRVSEFFETRLGIAA